MISIIGAFVFSVVIIMSILLIIGLPLGEFTMGGQYNQKVKRKDLSLHHYHLYLQYVFG